MTACVLIRQTGGAFPSPPPPSFLAYRAVDFFKEVGNCLSHVSPVLSSLYGDDWEARLQVKLAQANYVHMLVLFK